MTRTGKIARLPLPIREQLNARLHHGEVGQELVAWLNSLPEVQALLAAHFDRRPINEPNLTEWKQGGYEDWLAQLNTRAWIHRLIEDSAAFQQDLDNCSVTDLLAAPLAVTLGRLVQQQAAGAQHSEGHYQALFAATRELTRLRRADLAERQLRLQHERWQAARAAAPKDAQPKNFIGQLDQELDAFNGSLGRLHTILRQEKKPPRRVAATGTKPPV
jgi:hypothetical protein